jgi:hypothetical protein
MIDCYEREQPNLPNDTENLSLGQTVTQGLTGGWAFTASLGVK